MRLRGKNRERLREQKVSVENFTSKRLQPAETKLSLTGRRELSTLRLCKGRRSKNVWDIAQIKGKGATKQREYERRAGTRSL